MIENTKTHPGEFDALEKARPDELIFTLLERDPCAPASILFWCDERRKLAIDISDDDARREELRQITEGEFVALTMIERRKGIGQAAPKHSPAKSYSGIVTKKPAGEEIAGKLRAALSEADYFMNNALELARQAHAIGVIDEERLGHISDSARITHAMAMELSPHRAALLAEAELPLESPDNG